MTGNAGVGTLLQTAPCSQGSATTVTVKSLADGDAREPLENLMALVHDSRASTSRVPIFLLLKQARTHLDTAPVAEPVAAVPLVDSAPALAGGGAR